MDSTSSTTVEPVIAGSRGFALALLAPLTERIGTRPRIATGAAQARPFCMGPGGLVVVEFLGADTLHEIEALVRDAKGIRIVAAVPEKLAAAGAPLRALGVEVARWDGTAADVVGAVGRQLALASSADPAAPAAPTTPRPAPRTTPAPPTAAHAPAAPAAAVVKTPPPPTAARAASAPQPVVKTPPPPTARSASGAASAPQPDVKTPPPPTARSVSGAAPARPAPQPPAPPPARNPAPDLLPTLAPGLAAPPAQGPAATPRKGGAPAPAPEWPATVPGPLAAAQALRDAIASGAAPEGSAPAGIDGVLASLSDLELAVLAGEPQDVDTEPIRQAAVMRVRVASALATAPQPGATVDAGAVSALVAEIDALLAQVSELAKVAPEALQASLEAVRNALVREAIDFSEAVQRASPAGAPAEAAKPRPSLRASKTRLLTVEDAEPKAAKRGLAVWIALAAVIALAAGWHGLQWHKRNLARATLSAGLPAGLTQIPGPPGGPRVLVRSSTTAPPDPAEVARFKAVEEANGNRVREADGMIFIEPIRRDAAPPAEPAKP